MQTNEYLELRDHIRTVLQQNLIPITEVLELVDQAYGLGHDEGMRQIETKLPLEQMEKFKKALAGPEPQPEEKWDNRISKIDEAAQIRPGSGSTFYMRKSPWDNKYHMIERVFNSCGGSAEHDMYLEDLNQHEVAYALSKQIEFRE